LTNFLFSDRFSDFIGQCLSPAILVALFTRLKEQNLLNDKNLALILRPLVGLPVENVINRLPLHTLDLSELPFLSDQLVAR
jgi:hypothetical protein